LVSFSGIVKSLIVTDSSLQFQGFIPVRNGLD